MTVRFGEVVLQHLRQRFAMLLPSVEILERRAQRLDHKFVTRFEVLVKSSNGHTSLFHHIGHTNTLEPEIAESPCRDFQDPGVSMSFCFLWHITSKSLRLYPAARILDFLPAHKQVVCSYSCIFLARLLYPIYDVFSILN